MSVPGKAPSTCEKGGTPRGKSEGGWWFLGVVMRVWVVFGGGYKRCGWFLEDEVGEDVRG